MGWWVGEEGRREARDAKRVPEVPNPEREGGRSPPDLFNENSVA